MFIQPKKKKSKQPVQIQAVARLLNIFTFLYRYGLGSISTKKKMKIAWLKIINHSNLNYMKNFHYSIYYHE